jgi:uncharacterized protein (TIGR02996 family)
MNSEADFIAAITATPDDELLRSAFADWLEERGDPRAAWVRDRAVRKWMGPGLQDPIPKLIATLKSRRGVMKVRAVAAAIGAPFVGPLVELLEHEHPVVRLQAVQCLRRIGPPAAGAVPALMEALKDANFDVRTQAGNAIKDIDGGKNRESDAGAVGEAIRGLAAQLDDPDPEKRRAAVEGLASLKAREVLAPLCRALADADATVRAAAAVRLAGLVTVATTEAVGPLVAALSDPSPHVRYQAINALGTIGPPAGVAVDDLIGVLRGDNAWLAQAAASALGNIAADDPAVLEALHEATRHADETVAVLAAIAMEKWSRLPPESADELLALLRRLAEGPGNHHAVLVTLGRLEQPTGEVIEVLRDVIGRRGPGWGGAVRALYHLGPAAAAAIPELTDVVRRPAQFADHTPAQALARMGQAGVDRLVELLGDENEQVRNVALAGIREARDAAALAVPRLREMLQGAQSWWQRRQALWTVRVLGPVAAAAIPDIIPLLPEGDWGYDTDAVEALRAIGPALTAHGPRMVGLLRDSSHPWVPARVARLLYWLAKRGTDVVEPLREVLRVVSAVPVTGPCNDVRSAGDHARRFAIDGLAELGRTASAAAPDLLPLLTDPAEPVRIATVEAHAGGPRRRGPVVGSARPERDGAGEDGRGAGADRGGVGRDRVDGGAQGRQPAGAARGGDGAGQGAGGQRADRGRAAAGGVGRGRGGAAGGDGGVEEGPGSARAGVSRPTRPPRTWGDHRGGDTCRGCGTALAG